MENYKLTKQEKDFVKEKLSLFLNNLRFEDGLVVNGPGETWMDAVYKKDSRAGARIEINALALAACELARKLKIPCEFEGELKSTIKRQFWSGAYLKDGSEDKTARPNVFIAAYVCPELLSKQQWMNCFDNILPRLWLSWGGLASIDKKSSLFHSKHTGENSASYHRGDSWFWINNMAAIVLHRTNKKKYEKYIEKIYAASKKEFKELGARGHHAELSSARTLTSQGCLSQAWSIALLIELQAIH